MHTPKKKIGVEGSEKTAVMKSIIEKPRHRSGGGVQLVKVYGVPSHH